MRGRNTIPFSRFAAGRIAHRRAMLGSPLSQVNAALLVAIGEKRWTNVQGAAMLDSMTLSARNRLEGKIVELQFGGVMAHVVVQVGKNLIESVITKKSADEMKLKVGDTVSAIIKSTEVMLEKK
jgi:molybdopterin-binding protein